MKAFNIQIYSPIAFIGAFCTVVLSGTLGIRYSPIEVSTIVTYAFIVIVFACGFFFASHLSTAKIHIRVDESGFHHKWVKRFIFSREPDVDLSWDQVIDYSFEEDRSYYRFQLTLKSKLRYRFYRQTIWPVKDDFHRFQTSFPGLLLNAGAAESQNIVLGKTIYEERWFKWVLAIMSIGILLLLTNAISHGGSGYNWGTLGMLAAAVTFYWVRVRKKEEGK